MYINIDDALLLAVSRLGDMVGMMNSKLEEKTSAPPTQAPNLLLQQLQQSQQSSAASAMQFNSLRGSAMMASTLGKYI